MRKDQTTLKLAVGLIYLMAFSFAFAAEHQPRDGINDVHIRTLAASCAACHGHAGNPVEVDATQKNLQLAGEDKQKLIDKLLSFRSGQVESTVMHHHAKGLTEAEITTLAIFFSQQQKNVNPALANQTYLDPKLQ